METPKLMLCSLVLLLLVFASNVEAEECYALGKVCIKNSACKRECSRRGYATGCCHLFIPVPRCVCKKPGCKAFSCAWTKN